MTCGEGNTRECWCRIIEDKRTGIGIGRYDLRTSCTLRINRQFRIIFCPRGIHSAVLAHSEGTVYIQLSISDSGRRTDVAHIRTRGFRRIQVPSSRILNNLTKMTAVTYITLVLITPLVGIIQIERTGDNGFIVVLDDTYLRLFVDLHLHTRQARGALGELHSTAEQMDLEVAGKRQDKLTGIQLDFVGAFSIEHSAGHFSQVDDYGTQLCATIDLIHLLVVLGIVVLTHPGVIRIGHLVHEEHSRFALFADHLDGIGIRADVCHIHRSGTKQSRTRMVFHRRLHILDEIRVDGEEVGLILISKIGFCRHNQCQRYIAALPVAHLEHLTHNSTATCINFAGQVITITIFGAIAGYITPCAEFAAVVDGHVATGLQNQMAIVTSRHTHSST